MAAFCVGPAGKAPAAQQGRVCCLQWHRQASFPCQLSPQPLGPQAAIKAACCRADEACCDQLAGIGFSSNLPGVLVAAGAVRAQVFSKAVALFYHYYYQALHGMQPLRQQPDQVTFAVVIVNTLGVQVSRTKTNVSLCTCSTLKKGDYAGEVEFGLRGGQTTQAYNIINEYAGAPLQEVSGMAAGRRWNGAMMLTVRMACSEAAQPQPLPEPTLPSGLDPAWPEQ